MEKPNIYAKSGDGTGKATIAAAYPRVEYNTVVVRHGSA
jgi:hypothetical protein